jgi:hypothetical protein
MLNLQLLDVLDARLGETEPGGLHQLERYETMDWTMNVDVEDVRDVRDRRIVASAVLDLHVLEYLILGDGRTKVIGDRRGRIQKERHRDLKGLGQEGELRKTGEPAAIGPSTDGARGDADSGCEVDLGRPTMSKRCREAVRKDGLQPP